MIIWHNRLSLLLFLWLRLMIQRRSQSLKGGISSQYFEADPNLKDVFQPFWNGRGALKPRKNWRFVLYPVALYSLYPKNQISQFSSHPRHLLAGKKQNWQRNRQSSLEFFWTEGIRFGSSWLVLRRKYCSDSQPEQSQLSYYFNLPCYQSLHGQGWNFKWGSLV